MAKKDDKPKPENKLEAASQAADEQGKHGREKAYDVFQRDEKGLLKNVNYVFAEDFSIDWKRMIPEEYIVVNKEYFERRQIAVPDSAEGLDDKQKLILLGGIKELAKIRGLLSVRRKVIVSEPGRAVVSCAVVFVPNYETGMKEFEFEEVANATMDNVTGFGQNFLETIAANRAFVRAIRNALRIDIVGSDELAQAPVFNNSNTQTEGEPWHALRAAAVSAVTESFPNGFKTFDEFKGFLKSKTIEVVNDSGIEWADWSDVAPGTCFKLITSLKAATAKAKAKAQAKAQAS